MLYWHADQGTIRGGRFQGNSHLQVSPWRNRHSAKLPLGIQISGQKAACNKLYLLYDAQCLIAMRSSDYSLCIVNCEL